MSVMSNWEAQLNEHSDGSLTFCLYHGSGRYAHKPAALAKTDVVVTTYGCLVADASLLGKVGLLATLASTAMRTQHWAAERRRCAHRETPGLEMCQDAQRDLPRCR